MHINIWLESLIPTFSPRQPSCVQTLRLTLLAVCFTFRRGFFCVFWKWSVTFMEASALGWIEAQFLPDNVCHTCESSSGAMTAEWGSVHSSTAERQLCYERPSTAHLAFLKSMLLRSGQKDKAVMSSVSWRHQWMFLVIFVVLMVQECN